MSKFSSQTSSRLQSTQRSVSKWSVVMSAIGQLVFKSSIKTSSQPPFVRSDFSVRQMLTHVMIATLPCWLVGLWNIGHQIGIRLTESTVTVLTGWRGSLLSALGMDINPADLLVCFFLGLLYFMPVFLMALLVVLFWELMFSTIRRKSPSTGLLLFAWLFTMMMPAGIDPFKVVIGVSFGYVVGQAIFGGYGRYLVSPVVVGVTYLYFAYPGHFLAPESWVPVAGIDTNLALNLVVTGGIEAVQTAGHEWWDLFLGIRVGPMGSVSILGCLLGAIYLFITKSASWRIMLAALLGMLVAMMFYSGLANESKLLANVPIEWHVVLGTFSFALVFIATDPVAASNTVLGRWVFGFTIGLLTVVIRVSNPTYNDGVILAIFLASLFAPVIDFVVIELNKSKRMRKVVIKHE